MTDEAAIYIVLFGVLILAAAKILSRGDYEDRILLTAGHYLVGVDIAPGKADLTATSGAGSFCVKNKVEKSWSMGSPIGATSATEPTRFRNIALNKGDILEINGTVVLMLSPPVPVRDLEQETLGLGTYRFGIDVAPGKYDLEIVSGDGDALLVEVGKDSYSFFQDMAASDPIKASSFKNVVCTPEHELWVSGTMQIRLKPSEHQPFRFRFRKK